MSSGVIKKKEFFFLVFVFILMKTTTPLSSASKDGTCIIREFKTYSLIDGDAIGEPIDT